MKRRNDHDLARALSASIEPFVRALADQLAEMLRAHVEEKLAASRAFAIDRLRVELAGQADARPPDATETRTIETRAGELDRMKDGKRHRTCSICGSVNHDKRGHDRANGAPVEAPSPPPSSKQDRFSRIEAQARSRRGSA